MTMRRLRPVQSSSKCNSRCIKSRKVGSGQRRRPHPPVQALRLQTGSIAAVTAVGCCQLVLAQHAGAAAVPAIDPALISAFNEAMSSTVFETSDAAWTRAISIAPENAAAWSNRGTTRLQQGLWEAAYRDLQHSAELEQQQAGTVSPLLLNNLGNAEGALGKWTQAMDHYKQAATAPAAADEGMAPIALANYALAAFETGDNDLAIKSARLLLRRDSQFLDMQAALTAFLWGSGQRAAAEDSWEQLQQAEDGLGAAIYSRSGAVERVRHRWPPRATAALSAFLSMASCGQAEGYDRSLHSYSFTSAAAPDLAATGSCAAPS